MSQGAPHQLSAPDPLIDQLAQSHINAKEIERGDVRDAMRPALPVYQVSSVQRYVCIGCHPSSITCVSGVIAPCLGLFHTEPTASLRSLSLKVHAVCRNHSWRSSTVDVKGEFWFTTTKTEAQVTMKVTTVLCNHHIGRMIRNLWKVKSKFKVIDLRTEAALAPYDIVTTDAKTVIADRLSSVEKIHIDVVGITDPPKPRDEKHRLYHKKECHVYTSVDVVVKGLDQAKVITNTVEIQDGLPTALTQPVVCSVADRVDLIERCILSSNIFEAEQEKLPRYIDPERPYHHHARIYGITDRRKTELLTSRLIQLCGALCGVSRTIVQEGPVRVNVMKDGEQLQLSVKANMLLLAGQPIPALASASDAEGMVLPTLGPVHPLISIQTDHFYEENDVYPAGDRLYPHTLVLYGNVTEVRNLYETPVTETQWLGRSLLNTFAVAAAHARRRYGADVQDLPEPVMLQCCHTDGRLFHFCTLQLNTLNLDSCNSRRNIFWSVPRKALFEFCGYDSAQPVLRGFDPEVFEMLLAFYSHGITHEAEGLAA
ncbi:hypothetical protein PR048_003688 [Dryococelus australis]|uniref:Large ribosomal subunit protein mL37 n=1 Tax=Dryococelus australis TaxID=614101 RepID=A0ABQ9IQI5_9NEOP|nr:hypothetical protein PR048_003688 [Dryococelus australis]